jgi:NAD(P)-dependent dehydrogenase (short-subunit alcohol dehydrogenase family)
MPFGAQSTTDDVLDGIDLSGKRALVTGVSAGLGVETARVLAAHGAHVVGAARDLAKAEAATAVVREAAKAAGSSFSVVEMDLASLASVRRCADALNAKGDHFDIVILNAGVMACPRGATTDGFETQFGTNHLGHFVFANRIAGLINAGGRLVALSSGAHRFSDVNLEDPNFETTPYTEFGAYGRSKTANALFALEFDNRWKARGVRAASVHPGVIQTELGRHLTPDVIRQMFPDAGATGGPPPTFVYKSIPQGAATSVWAAVRADADAVGGRYCEDCHVAERSDDLTSPGGVRAYAQDPATAKALWALSEKMVGETF